MPLSTLLSGVYFSFACFSSRKRRRGAMNRLGNRVKCYFIKLCFPHSQSYSTFYSYKDSFYQFFGFLLLFRSTTNWMAEPRSKKAGKWLFSFRQPTWTSASATREVYDWLAALWGTTWLIVCHYRHFSLDTSMKVFYEKIYSKLTWKFSF